MPAVQLTSLLIGAALTLLTQLTVQLYVIPRVEARKRREDRWENDVLALGELLTAKLPRLAREAELELWSMHTFHRMLDSVEDIDDARREIKQQELKKKADEAVDRYLALADIRAGWLVDRIVCINPHAKTLAGLQKRWRLFHLRTIGCTTLWDFVGDEDFKEEDFKRAWAMEAEQRKNLTAIVSDLAHARPPSAWGTSIRPYLKPAFRLMGLLRRASGPRD